MKLQNIRPIPKAMLRKIERRDKKDHPAQDGHVRWYSYLARYGKELVKVTVAVKNHKKEWFCKQAAVHGLDSERCYVKDMKYSYLGGYTVGWYAEGIQKTERWYEGGWGVSEDKYFDPWAPVINPEYLKGFQNHGLQQGRGLLLDDRLLREVREVMAVFLLFSQ